MRRAWLAYSPELRRVAVSRAHDVHRAEDLVQETFLRAWRHADQFDPSRGSLRGWLFAILRNVVIDAARAATVRPVDARPVEEGLAAHDDLEARLAAMLVEDALEQLSVEHRQVVVASYLHDVPHTAIARSLDVPIGTVRSRLFYARRRLAAYCACPL